MKPTPIVSFVVVSIATIVYGSKYQLHFTQMISTPNTLVWMWTSSTEKSEPSVTELTQSLAAKISKVDFP